MTAYGGPTGYVAMWLRHAGQREDAVFRLYVMLFLLDLMSEHGHMFNGNARVSTAEDRRALRAAFEDALSAVPVCRT